MVNRAEERKFHYIYKITRIDGSGKFYVGMHSTDDLEDGYFGSGQLLWKSIKKHGKEKHVKEILEFLPSRAELKVRERQLVNEDLLGNKLCMNLKLGGEGGSHGREAEVWNRPGFKDKVTRLQSIGVKRKWTDHSYRENMKVALATRWKDQNYRNKTLVAISFAGKHHSEKTKLAIGKANAAMIGDKNSQFGTCWINKQDEKPIKIKKEFLEEYLRNGYSRGRK